MIIRKKYLFMGLFLLCFTGVAGLYLKGSAEEARGKVEIQWLSPLKYYKGNDFVNGRAWAQEEENGPWSLLDDQGNVLKTGFEASYVSLYRNDIAIFFLPAPDGGEKSWDFGYLDRSGDVIISPGALDAAGGLYNEGLACKKGENGLRGFINLRNKWVIPPIYDDNYPFKAGMAAVGKGGKYGFIDKKGDVVIDFKFDEVESFSHEMAPVRVGSKWGFIDKKGDVVIDFKFDEVESFSHEMAPVRVGSKWGFIDQKGDVVIDFKFDEVESFSHEIAPVWINSKWGVIDTNGRWIAEPIYGAIYGADWSGPIGLEKGDKVGFIDSKGNVVIDFQYPSRYPFVMLEGKEIFTNLYYFSNGRAIVILDDSDRENLEFGLIDESGKVLFRRKGCVLTIQGGYILCCLNENKQLSLIDRDGREYALPDNFKYPSTWGGQNDSDVYLFYDRKTDKRGYFKMSVNRD